MGSSLGSYLIMAVGLAVVAAVLIPSVPTSSEGTAGAPVHPARAVELRSFLGRCWHTFTSRVRGSARAVDTTPDGARQWPSLFDIEALEAADRAEIAEQLAAAEWIGRDA